MTGREKETFDEYMRRTASWGVYIENALLRRALSGPDRLKHFHTVKALFFFLEKREVIIHKRRPVSARYEINYTTEITFSFDEAERRGIPRKYFFRATRDLHVAGYIDIIYIGSGSLKDASRYRLSKRWRTGEHLPIPERKRVRRDQDRPVLRRTESGRWVRSGDISQVGKQPPARVANHLLEEAPQVAKHLLENDRFAQNTSGQSPTNLKTYQEVRTAFDDDGLGSRGEERGLKSNSSQSRRDEAEQSPSKNNGKAWWPPTSEIRENVAEILRQRSDPRADDRRFLSLLVDHLDGARRGRLDPHRVRRDLQDQHDLDDWVTELLFAIAAVNTPNREDRARRADFATEEALRGLKMHPCGGKA